MPATTETPEPLLAEFSIRDEQLLCRQPWLFTPGFMSLDQHIGITLGSNWSRCWDKQRAKTLVTQLFWTFGIYGIQSEDGKTQILESRLSLTEEGCRGSEAQVWETWPRNWQDEFGGHCAVEWGFQAPVCCCVVWLCAGMVDALKHFSHAFLMCLQHATFIYKFLWPT